MSNIAVTHMVLEAIAAGTTRAEVTQAVLEAIIPTVSRSPKTVTGAGVTHVGLEAIIAAGSPPVKATQAVIEVCVLDTSTPGQPNVGPNAPTKSSAYAI